MIQVPKLENLLDALRAFEAGWYLTANEDVRASGMDPYLHFVRHGFAEGRAPGPDPAPEAGRVFRVLYALSVLSGGTPQTNEDLMGALSAQADVPVDCLVLRCLGRELSLYLYRDGRYLELRSHTLQQPIAPFPHASEEFDKMAGHWLAEAGVVLVHVRHSALQSLGLMDAASELGIPVVYSFHDYYAACPSVKLLDDNRQFCGGRCTASRGECYQELWPDHQVMPLKHESVYKWQGQFAGALALCSGFVCTVGAVKNTMLDVFPALAGKPFPVIPHGRDFQALASLAMQPGDGKPLRVLVPGHIAASKGAEILQHLAGMQELAHVRWHILGTLHQDFEHAMPENVVVHGAYQRGDFQRHVAEIKPHMGAVLSIWPETWCHTLTELWAAGLPVLGFKTGAVGERLQQSGAGWLAESISPAAIAHTLLHASQPDVWRQAVEQVENWQKNGQRSCAEMAGDYWQLYNRITDAGFRGQN